MGWGDESKPKSWGTPTASAEEERAQIAAFWGWWAGARPRIEEALARRDFGGLAAEISARVRAIHPKAQWEIGPGRDSQFELSLSSEGDIAVRRVTERWVRAAPPRSATWAFFPAKAARVAGATQLEIAQRKVDLADTRVALTVDDTRERIDVRVFHPAFSELDESLRSTIAFLALDGALGEDEVERWLGAIELSVAPLEGVSLEGLVDTARTLAVAATREKFVVLRGERDGLPVFVTLNRALKRIDHLDKDQHVRVTARLLAPTPEGLTTDAEANALHAVEDALIEALGADAVFAGRVTHGGARTWHFYATAEVAESGVLTRFAGSRARDSNGHTLTVQVGQDTTWRALADSLVGR